MTKLSYSVRRMHPAYSPLSGIKVVKVYESSDTDREGLTFGYKRQGAGWILDGEWGVYFENGKNNIIKADFSSEAKCRAWLEANWDGLKEGKHIFAHPADTGDKDQVLIRNTRNIAVRGKS